MNASLVNAFLFVATTLIWGTTWIAIAFQMGPVPALVSVFYRFALAATAFVGFLAMTGRLSAPSRRDAPFILVQAICLFSCNFLCFYAASHYIPTGLESVIFSLASVFNAINARIFFGDRIDARTCLAGALGVSGVGLMFAPDLMIDMNADALTGIGLASLGTMFFSLGNMASRRNSAAGVPVFIANAWGMAAGSALLFALIVATGTPLVAPPDARYLLALTYLAIFGSVIGFTTYLSMVARIGSAKAAYATVCFPLIALAASTFFENYQWSAMAILGVLLTILGNIAMFRRPPDRKTVVSSSLSLSNRLDRKRL